jgi:hypothetical protein
VDLGCEHSSRRHGSGARHRIDSDDLVGESSSRHRDIDLFPGQKEVGDAIDSHLLDARELVDEPKGPNGLSEGILTTAIKPKRFTAIARQRQATQTRTRRISLDGLQLILESSDLTLQ